MTKAPCPDCNGDGATYEQVRVGQHATPFICFRCDGDGEVTDPNIPIEQAEVHALREHLALELARANALQDALDKEREKAPPATDAQEPTDAEVLAALNTQVVVVSPKVPPASSLNYWGDKHVEAMRAALSAARTARRDEEDKP